MSSVLTCVLLVFPAGTWAEQQRAAKLCGTPVILLRRDQKSAAR